MDNKILPFENKRVRSVWHNNEWFFSIVDIIEVLTDATQPRTYWAKLKKKITDESQLLPIWQQLKLMSDDGKKYKTDCANTEGVLRIVMSVPSPKAEPFKLWLAKVGQERLEEMEDPEIGFEKTFERLEDLYRAKGYSDEWIERRMRGIEARKRLTDEWKTRDIKEGQEYSILTAEIAKGTFGLTPKKHKELKGLDKQNLRDHMTPLELIFTALGEEVTRRLTVENDAQGFNENKDQAQKGGKMAGDARKRIEKQGMKVISSENFLNLKEGDNKSALPDSDNIDKL
jgi:DNA-damage-inducible protein D